MLLSKDVKSVVTVLYSTLRVNIRGFHILRTLPRAISRSRTSLGKL